MNTLKQPIVGLILFVALASLCITIYGGLQTQYGVTETDTKEYNGTDGNIMTHLSELGIMDTADNFAISVRKIVVPTGITDILGGLAGVAIGSLKLVWDIFTFPVQIMNIILLFYEVPIIIVAALNIIIFIYVAFLFISAYLGRDM